MTWNNFVAYCNEDEKKKDIESTEDTIPWNGRLEKPLVDRLKPFAKRGRRTLGAQINLVIEEWLERQPKQTSVGIPPTPMTPRQAQAVPPPVPPAPPKPAPGSLQEIVETDEGWEGLPPKTGAQVKI